MKKGKKIGIVTWFNIENYGTALQAISLYKYLTNQYDCTLIQYFDYKNIRPLYGKIKLSAKTILFFPLFVRRLMISGNIIKGLKISRVYKKINILSVKTKGQMKRIEAIDVFVTGSDQIWNPYYLKDFYLLGFTENNNKIAYSSSIGVQEIPAELEKTYIKYLSKFRHISIREKSSEAILKRVLSRNDICTVLDPVFLLSKKEWENFYAAEAKKLSNKRFIKEKYIFCYFIGKRKEYKIFCDSISSVAGISNVLYVPSAENKRISLNGRAVHSAGLEDFLFLIANAELVLTDSFHATVLSLIFEKQFIEFMRFDENDKKSQNSRIYDLLERYGIQNRIYKGESILKNRIDYSVLNKKLQADIDFSKNYLDNAIGGEEHADL